MPVSRCKHAAALHGQHVYLLGGRNGNLALKDFWRYHIGRPQADSGKNKDTYTPVLLTEKGKDGKEKERGKGKRKGERRKTGRKEKERGERKRMGGGESSGIIRWGLPNEISEMREGESLEIERETERYIGFLVLAKLVLNGLAYEAREGWLGRKESISTGV